MGSIMDKSLGTLLHFSGVFPINTGQTPPLTPQAKLEACIQIFSSFNFKDALFYKGTQK